MFTEIAKGLLPNVEKATFIMSGTEDDLTLVVICDPKKDQAKVQPIRIKGAAAEIASELQKAIALIFEDNKELASNAEEVAKKYADDLKKKAAAPAASTTTAAKKEEPAKPVGLTKPTLKAELKAYDEIQELIKKAKKSTDLDMCNFMKKQALEKLKLIKSQKDKEAWLEEQFDTICKDKKAAASEEVKDGMFAQTKTDEPASNDKTGPKTKQPAAAPVADEGVDTGSEVEEEEPEVSGDEENDEDEAETPDAPDVAESEEEEIF
jgi:PRTRC genetic system protein E